MAEIVGGIATSHVPAIYGAIAKGLQRDPYWKPFFDGIPPLRAWLAETRPEAVIVFYNDHGLNFFLDNLPTFAIGAAQEYLNDDEGWGMPAPAPFRGAPALSWRLIEHLVEHEFDIATCQNMKVDHAFVLPLQLLWPDGDAPPAVPISINTVQHPLPSVGRCLKLGRAIGAGLASWQGAERIAVIASGGLSHQLDGERAGFMNQAFDLEFLDELVRAPDVLTRLTIDEVVEKSGTQGVELLSWVAMRGVLGGAVQQRLLNYHIPISNTAGCQLLLTR
ncbi:MAG: protocatechuate 3,4-dioxygenase [Hyphomonadaceae bacterium]|nr:protocatechuate 3,4-dioxygenase [Hyphomonadaceae bacterium]